MIAQPIHCSIDKDGYKVEASCFKMGEDYLLSIWGGKAHIGAVAMAQPRDSLHDSTKRSATASVFCYLGHKEDELVKRVSEEFAAKLNAKVVVVAGLHWDDLSPEGVKAVLSNTDLLLADLIRKIKNSGAAQ